MDFQEFYDNGYLVTGGILDEDMNKWGVWVIKTDINGNTLWDKKIIHNNSNNIAILSCTSDKSGEVYMSGSIYLSVFGFWPLIIKFDSCGEKIWCRYFYTDQFIGGVFRDNLILDNNDILSLAYFSSDNYIRQIFIICFDENGNLKWMQPYATQYDHPEIGLAFGRELLKNQNSYYITGYCYWPYPENPHVWWLRPFFIGIDSLFNEKWILPFGVSDSIVGEAMGVLPLSESEYLGYGKCFPDAKSNDLTQALLMRFNNNGEEKGYCMIDRDEINPPTNYNLIQKVVAINDTLFMASANFGPLYQGNPNGEYIFDLNGHIYQYQSHPSTDWKSKVIKTFDNKYVFCTDINESGNPQYSDILLYKLNANLEQDTVYTGNYMYDSLCPYQIQSGIIDISDCDMTVNIKEIPSPKEYYASLKTILVKVFPNPGKKQVTLQFENTQYHTNILLQCFDLLGRELHEEKVYPYQGASIVDVSGWNDGMYMAVVTGNGRVVGRCKFIVRR